MNIEKRIHRAMQDWLRLRPFLYHFAPLDNIRQVIARGEMYSAQQIVEKAIEYDASQIDDADTFLSTPRPSPVSLRIGPGEQDVFALNNQEPMTRGNCFDNLECSPAEFVRKLNTLVFFWPGDAAAPRTKGKHAASFVARYHHFAALRIRFADVHNLTTTLRFCGCNSGAPQKRDGIRRSPAIFRSFDEPAIVGQAVEVVAEGILQLSDALEYRANSRSPWIPVDHKAQQSSDIQLNAGPGGVPA